MVSAKFIAFAIVLVAFLSTALGHSYLTNPISRSNQKETNTGCRGPNCLGPCDRSKNAATRPPIVIQRGASISVEWPRNNHAGGFIRLAWAPTALSDSHAAFDAGVQQISCHEVGGCKPDNVNDPNGGDSAPTDGSFQPCKTSIQVPNHLADGLYTLQWSWFGGAYALGDYYSCVDYKIEGGGAIAASAAAPVFKGGDFTYPGQQKCKYFNTDRLHRCVNEPCDNPVYPAGERSGMPYMTVAVPVNPPAAPVTTKAVTTQAAPSPLPPAAPVTTKAVTTKALTTSQMSSPPSGGSGSSGSSSGSSGNANCAGVTIPASSYVVITDVETWRNSYLISLRVTVTESSLPDWRLRMTFPSNAPSATVAAVYNAGKLSCQSSTPSRHTVLMPAGDWAKNLSQGNTLDIQVEVNAGVPLTEQYIINNTQLKLYKL